MFPTLSSLVKIFFVPCTADTLLRPMANCIRCGRQLPGFTFGKKICQWCKQHEAYQRGEVFDDAPQTVMPTPWVRRSESAIGLTQIIFGINVAVFLGMALSGSTVMDFPVRELIVW